MKDHASFTDLGRLRPLLEEIGELKRADFQGRSVASRAFSEAWAALVGGADPAALARQQLRHALAATVLGGIDGAVMADAGLDPDRIADIRSGAIAQRRGVLGDAVLESLAPDTGLPKGAIPHFCVLLEGAPRAGATAPGQPRLILRPAENHAEHCWVVAVYGALLASISGEPDAVVGRTFLIGLSHHFPNAWLPDAGFSGEIALGESLDPVFATFTERALGQLPPTLADVVRTALALKDDPDDPAGAAFVLGDVFDRVLELYYYERAFGFRLADAMGPMDLVHAGPLRTFQYDGLRAAGIVA